MPVTASLSLSFLPLCPVSQIKSRLRFDSWIPQSHPYSVTSSCPPPGPPSPSPPPLGLRDSCRHICFQLSFSAGLPPPTCHVTSSSCSRQYQDKTDTLPSTPRPPLNTSDVRSPRGEPLTENAPHPQYHTHTHTPNCRQVSAPRHAPEPPPAEFTRTELISGQI